MSLKLQKFVQQMCFGLVCMVAGAFLERAVLQQGYVAMQNKLEDAMVENVKLHSIVGPNKWLLWHHIKAGQTLI